MQEKQTIYPIEASTRTHWLEEFAQSGISPELAKANARWIEGQEAVEEFLEGTIAQQQRETSYITASNRRLMDGYEHLEAGGWIAYGVCLDGSMGEVPYLKPSQPRWDEKKDKPIKYETPPRQPATPLLPNLEPKAEVFRRLWGIEPIWKAILAHVDIHIIITEGWKKALALVELGIPAVAIPGITQWHPKNCKELRSDLAKLAAGGRKVLIAFDQDEKLKTRADVSRQARLLGNAIERAGGKPAFLVWDGTQGKGIDDVLVALPPAERLPWLQERMAKALNPKEQRRQADLAHARQSLDRPKPRADRHTTGEYLPTLPCLVPGALHWISATMNSGKTRRIGEDWVQSWRQNGGTVLVLSPLNSLGQQTAKNWELPHIHDYRTDPTSQQALEAAISCNGGLVCCFNSIHRAMELLPKDAPLLLIIDEAVQVLSGAVQGSTLKREGEWNSRWEDTIVMMKRAAATGAIVLAEDGLDVHTINLVQQHSGCQKVIGISHTKELEPWDCTVYRATPLSAYRAKLLAQLQAGATILYVTTSQKEGRRLERWAKKQGIDSVRIDSEANERGAYTEFFENPDAWLKQRRPQLLILSPSAKTGLSIEGGIAVEKAYFNSVWGYFPALDTDTWKQLLGRYRPAVPRFIWAPAFVRPDWGEGPKAWGISRGFEQDAKNFAHAQVKRSSQSD